MTMYVIDTEVEASLHYKLDHSQHNVPLLRLYMSQGPILNEVAGFSWFSRAAHKQQLTQISVEFLNNC